MTVKRRSPILFKGWDWTELLQLEKQATKWPGVPDDFEWDFPEFMHREDAEASYLIKAYLNEIYSRAWEPDVETKRVAKYVRKFCLALSRAKYDPSCPVYAGIAKVKQDQVLFGWVINNLEKMWTRKRKSRTR